LTQAKTRRDRNAEATRQVIMRAGRELFATQPYPYVTNPQICARAGVTRGALQHHFGNKLGLFTAVFDGFQNDVVSRIMDAVADHHDPWKQAWAAIVAYLDACTVSDYQTVVLKEGPAALGWQRWRERQVDDFADAAREVIGNFAAADLIKHSAVMFTALMRGALTEMSFQIARSDDQTEARTAALAVLDDLMSKFRELSSDPRR
jgi:AcrR family transcriptional regulator